MSKKMIKITEPTLPAFELLQVRSNKIIKSRMITNADYVREFETKVAKYIGVKHAVAVSSCTSGLMLVLKAYGLSGEVICPSFTFHATTHAIVWNKLKPIFVDCDRDTLNLDPQQVEKTITKKTSAIVGVHIFGNPSPIDELQAIAKKHKIKLIFDAAHGFGARHHGNNIGRFGDAEVFSLSPTKLLTAGEGGLVTTNDKKLAETIRIGRNYGDSGTYDSEFSGLNARMSEFHALLGIESLKTLERNVVHRAKLVRLYKKLLSDVPGIHFQKVANYDRSSFKDFSMVIDPNEFGTNRDVVQDELLRQGIGSKKYFYPPVHKQKAFLKFARGVDKRLPVTKFVSENCLSIPLYSHMPKEFVERIAKTLKRIQVKHA